jgi:hypothetical protein
LIELVQADIEVMWLIQMYRLCGKVEGIWPVTASEGGREGRTYPKPIKVANLKNCPFKGLGWWRM